MPMLRGGEGPREKKGDTTTPDLPIGREFLQCVEFVHLCGESCCSYVPFTLSISMVWCMHMCVLAIDRVMEETTGSGVSENFA